MDPKRAGETVPPRHRRCLAGPGPLGYRVYHPQRTATHVTPPSPPPLEDRRTAAIELLSRLSDELLEAQATGALISRLNDRPDVREAFKNTFEANGLNSVFRGLLHLVVINLARICDSYAPKRPNRGQDRASLRRLMALLDDKELLRRFIDDARRWFPHGSRAERDARSAVRAIQRARVRYKRFATFDLGKKALTAIREFRDIHLAHTLVGKAASEALLYRYIDDVLRQTERIMEHLQLGMLGNTMDVPGFTEVRKSEDVA